MGNMRSDTHGIRISPRSTLIASRARCRGTVNSGIFMREFHCKPAYLRAGLTITLHRGLRQFLRPVDVDEGAGVVKSYAYSF